MPASQQFRRSAHFHRGYGHQRRPFIGALALSKVDVLGFSIVVSWRRRSRASAGPVRKLILVGTGPRGGEGMASLTPESAADFRCKLPKNPTTLGSPSILQGQKRVRRPAGGFLKRFRRAKRNRDPEVNERVAPAHSKPWQMGAFSSMGR